MSEPRGVLFSIFFVLLSLFVAQLSVAAAPRKGIVQGTQEANLRTGPGVDYGVKGIVKENEQLTVQGQEGEWYLVETAAGQKGYLYKNFLKIAGEEQAGATITDAKKEKTAADESKETTKAPVPATDAATTEQSPPPPPAPPQKITQPLSPSGPPNQPPKSDERKVSSNKAPSLIELLDGREADMILWLCIAVIFFLIGWISGGHYYLRRDRARRTRLRF